MTKSLRKVSKKVAVKSIVPWARYDSQNRTPKPSQIIKVPVLALDPL